MNLKDIIRMAREACPYTDDELRGAFYEGYLKGVAAERESLAAEAEKNGNTVLAMQIRARGNK